MKHASSYSWHKYLNKKDLIVSIDTFGESGKAEDLFNFFGFNTKNIVGLIKKKFSVITLKKKFSDITNFVFNKKVIVRADLNLPYFDGKNFDFTRVEKILPTIDFLLKNRAKIILISHFGRPKSEK